MNRSFLLVVIPALLVLAGYIGAFHYLGIAPNYFRLIAAAVGFAAAAWWVRRRAARKAKPGGR